MMYICLNARDFSWAGNDHQFVFHFSLFFQVHPTTGILVNEGGSGFDITVRPTVPIICPANPIPFPECVLDVIFRTKQFEDQAEIATSQCAMQFTIENWETEQVIEVNAVRDFVNDGTRDVALEIRTVPATFRTPPEWTHPDMHVDVTVGVVRVVQYGFISLVIYFLLIV